MSQQIQITGGAKVRNLEGVLTGTSGVVNALAINVPNGIPQLDGSGKILVSQLPNSVMEYQGTWNAATNTPTLADGTGNQGDVYLCNVAGTVDFGAGPIVFFVGDQVIYSGTIWQRASGASGTVTSVAVTETGDSLNITGSPITTSGTINIGFNGTNLQYINGAGNLTTFPSLTGYVPYTGATANVDLGVYDLTADLITGATGSFASNGGSDTFAINHSSGAGIALNITKGGNGEGLYINKTSGSGNAATIVGTLEATTLVKTGGTSSQFLKADGTIDSSAYLTTSAASSTYVPYTGATTDVNLGTFDLSAYAVSADILEARLNGTASSPLILRTGTSGFAAGLNAISLISSPSIANTLSIISDVSSVTKTAQIGLGSLSATRTYTLPDASGTLPLLESTQTFTGVNTFSGLTSFTFSSGTRMDYGPYLTKGSVPTVFSGTTTNIYSDATTNNIVIRDNSSSAKLEFNNSTQTFTFPAASGTLALLESTQTFTGENYFSLVTMFDQSVNYKTGGVLVGVSGYISQGYDKTGTGAGSTLSMKIADGNSVKNISLDFVGSPVSTPYTYTFPAASGTISLLESTQTFSGTNTFGFIKADNGVLLKNGVVPASTGYTGIGAGIGTGIDITMSGSIYTQSLYFQTSAAYIYTFPSATGTIALTSDIPTISGTTNYHAKFTGTSTIGNSLIWDNGTNVGIGNTNTSYTLDVTGTARFGSDTVNGDVTISSNNLPLIVRGRGASSANGLLFTWDTGAGVIVGPSLQFYTGGTLGSSVGTQRMTITSTGLVGIGTTSPSYTLDVYAASGYAARLNGPTYGGLILANAGTANTYMVGESTLLSIEHTTAINLRTNNADRVRITSAGNVGIGTSSPAKTLDVFSSNGNATAQIKVKSTGNTSAGYFGVFSNQLYISAGGTYDSGWSIDGTNGIANIVMETSNGGSAIGFGTANSNTTATERMRISSGGKVMVNTSDSGANALLYASASSSEPYPLGSRAMTSSQGLVGFFDSANGLQGSISISGSTVSYNSFLGSHWSQLSDNSKPEILTGTILEAIDELCVWDNVTDERLPKVKISDSIESKNVYGVFSNWDNTDDYNDMYVAAVGAGFIRVNSSSIVSMGDLLQSNGDGTAKVQSDDIMRSSTIAKVTSTQKITTYEDGSYLIAATLHCG